MVFGESFTPKSRQNFFPQEIELFIPLAEAQPKVEDNVVGTRGLVGAAFTDDIRRRARENEAATTIDIFPIIDHP